MPEKIAMCHGYRMQKARKNNKFNMKKKDNEQTQKINLLLFVEIVSLIVKLYECRSICILKTEWHSSTIYTYRALCLLLFYWTLSSAIGLFENSSWLCISFSTIHIYIT